MGAIGGAMAGLQDDDDTVQDMSGTQSGTTSETSTTTFAPKSQQQQLLENSSLQSYLQQLQQQQQLESRLGGYDALGQSAQGAAQNILSGQGFGLTPDEQMRIMAQRQATIDATSNDLNRFTEQGLTQATSDAGARGLRGQAMGELRGRVVQNAQDRLGSAIGQANQTAAQQAMMMPQQRLQLQQGTINQTLSLPEQLRMQAQQSRQALQSPFLMQQLQNERLAGGTRSSTSSNTGSTTGQQIGRGQEGSFTRGLQGFNAGSQQDIEKVGGIFGMFGGGM